MGDGTSSDGESDRHLPQIKRSPQAALAQLADHGQRELIAKSSRPSDDAAASCLTDARHFSDRYQPNFWGWRC
jgi:hypothetical protein